MDENTKQLNGNEAIEQAAIDFDANLCEETIWNLIHVIQSRMNSGAVVWSKDMKAEGAAADEMGMGRVLGLGRRIGEIALILKAGKEAIASQGMEFDKENKLWVDKKDDIDAGVL